MTKKPNILLIMTDEHDPAVMGCMGDPIVETPNMDRLAQEGVLFENYYCNSPLCVPSRLSFTSGKYVSRVNAWNNQSTLPADIQSVPSLMNKAGYETILCGKMHYAKGKRYGFEHDFLPHHNTSIKFVNTRRRMADDRTVDIWNWVNRSSKFRDGDDSRILTKDKECTEATVEFLKNRKNDDKPFFYLLGYLAPHFPLIVPAEIAKKYHGKIPAPAEAENMIENLPKNYKHLRRGFGYIYAKDETTMKGRDYYWGLVDWLDHQLGIVLNTLNKSEVADDTIVIFTSDHGENKGDHGLWWKNCCYDHAAKVPMIFKWPQKDIQNQKRDKVASHVDLVKTLLEIAESDVPEDWNGDSFVPYLLDNDYNWKDQAVCEYHGHNIVSGVSMFRKGKYKLVYHAAKSREEFGSEYELFDLEEDPDELNNLAYEDDYRSLRDELMQNLIDEIGKHPDDVEVDYDEYVGKLRYWWSTRMRKLGNKLVAHRMKKHHKDKLDLTKTV